MSGFEERSEENNARLLGESLIPLVFNERSLRPCMTDKLRATNRRTLSVVGRWSRYPDALECTRQ